MVPKSFEAGAYQDTPTVAIVHEAQLGIAFQAVTGDALRHRLQLAVDRVLLGLLFPRDTGIERHTEIIIGHGWSSSLGLRSEIPGRHRDRLVVRASQWRPLQGPGDERDQLLICTCDQLILEAR